LNDVSTFDFVLRVWSTLSTEGVPPIPRDSHVAVVHSRSMFVFGGSTGSAMNDFHELKLDTCQWHEVRSDNNNNNSNNSQNSLLNSTGGFNNSNSSSSSSSSMIGNGPPGHRFCHVAVVHKESMYVFGGYDGSNRLNDFIQFHFGLDLMACDIPPSTLHHDMSLMVNNESFSDICFEIEGVAVYAHKIMLTRCSYFKAMLSSNMRETTQRVVRLEQVRHPIFLALLTYLYTDSVDVPLEIAMELFQAADQFGVERLKKMCEAKMLASITVENAASIFHASDLHTARSLREKCLGFILVNFEAVSKSKSFEEMARGNVELVFEILRKR
jgi:hypothetical protein